MKIFTLAILTTASIISTTAQARIQPIFAADGSKATMMVLGGAGDTDATKLFDAMSAAIEDINGKLTKKMAFDDPTGKRVMSIVCVLSKVVKDSGTCTLILNAVPGTVVDKSAGVARLTLLESQEAQRMAANFHMPPTANLVIPIYYSADNRLAIQAQLNESASALQTFSVEYR